MKKPRRIAVVTGSRADYGLLYWVMKGIQEDAALDLRLLVTGMHLSPEFGYTCREIEADGFTVDAKVETLLSSDTAVGIAKSIGLGCIGFADAFAAMAPDLVLLLGDRFESFAAAQAAMVARLPIAHIHGGEATEGLIDEAIRHAITKMSHLHFVSAEAFRSRVIQLGESPERVFVVGAPGLDHIRRTKLMPANEIRKRLDLSRGRRLIVVTYHPVTLSSSPPARQLGELLTALDAFPDVQIVFTYPNADTSGREIIAALEAYSRRRRDDVRLAVSLGQRKYLSLVKCADIVVGNSSSGLIEVPSFGKPTVNIGDRQKGRLRATSVIDCAEERGAIEEAIRTGLGEKFAGLAKRTVNPYGDGRTAPRIVRELKRARLEGILMKTFFDLGGA